MSTTAVRVHEVTKAMIDNIEARINKARKANKMAPLTKMQVIELAVRNLTVEMGVSK